MGGVQKDVKMFAPQFLAQLAGFTVHGGLLVCISQTHSPPLVNECIFFAGGDFFLWGGDF